MMDNKSFGGSGGLATNVSRQDSSQFLNTNLKDIEKNSNKLGDLFRNIMSKSNSKRKEVPVEVLRVFSPPPTAASSNWLVVDKDSLSAVYTYDAETNDSLYNDDRRAPSDSYQENDNNQRSFSTVAAKFNRSESFTDGKGLINSLPVELICKIMCYLDFSDRKNASLVCKKWRSAFFESCFLKSVLFKANNQLFFLANRPSSSSAKLTHSTHRASSSMALPSDALLYNTYLYDNIINLDIENDSADVSLLIKHLETKRQALIASFGEDYDANMQRIFLLPKLKSISLIKCTLSSKTLLQLLKESPNLRSLGVIHCDSLFMTGFLGISTNTANLSLENLEELILSKNRYVTDHLLNFFVSSSSRITRLDLSHCCLTKSNYKSIGNNLNNPFGSSASMAVLTLENLFRLLENELHQLRSINLSGIDLFNHDDQSLIKIVEKLPNLDELYLANLPSLKLDAVLKIQKIRPNLKLIDLNGSIQVDETAQNSIELYLQASVEVHEDKLSKLETLKFSKAKINNPYLFLESIGSMARLTYLDLSCIMIQCSFVTVSKRNQYISEFATNLAQCIQLESLLLSYCDILVTDPFVQIISKSLTKLKYLSLRNCTQITDASLHYISQYLKNLIFLDVSWCQNLSDYGLDRGIEIDKRKKMLNDLNKHLNGPCLCMRKYAEQPFLLIKTKAAINSMDASGMSLCACAPTTDIVSEPENNQNEEFKDQNSQPQDELDANVNLKRLRNLKVLKMESCINISDQGLRNGVDLSRLSELDVKMCTNLTGEFILNNSNDYDQMNNKQKAYSNLKVLDLSQCINFKEEHLVEIIENSPNLRELNVSAISSVTNLLLNVLLERKRLLSLLDVSFCSNVSEAYVEKYEQFLYNEFGSREFNIRKRFINQ